MSNENTNIAIIIAVVALLVSIIGAGYVILNQPADVDVDGIDDNRALINILQSDRANINSDIDYLKSLYRDFDNYDIDEDDLEDLEDYAKDFYQIDDNTRDINRIKDCAKNNNENTFTDRWAFINCLINNFD